MSQANPKTSWPLARALHLEKDDRTADMIRGALAKLPAQETVKYLKALLRKRSKDDRLAAIAALWRRTGRPRRLPSYRTRPSQ